MRALKMVCFTICIVCIVGSVLISLSLIWGSTSPTTTWQSLASLGVVFLGSFLTMGVISMVESSATGSKKD